MQGQTDNGALFLCYRSCQRHHRCGHLLLWDVCTGGESGTLAVEQRENVFEGRRWLCGDAVVMGGLAWCSLSQTHFTLEGSLLRLPKMAC